MKQEAAKFICVWYSPPFSVDARIFAREKMRSRISASKVLLGRGREGFGREGRLIRK
jgi:hypothetical protein